MSSDGKRILVIGQPSGNELRILAHHLAGMGNVGGTVVSVDECRAAAPEPLQIVEFQAPDFLAPDAQANWDGEKYGEGHGHLKQPFGKIRNPNRRQHRGR